MGVLYLQALGSVIIVTGAVLVIVSQVYRRKKRIWGTKSVIETSEKVNGVPVVPPILLPSHPILTILSGKFKELNSKQILLRICPYLQVRGFKALTPTWYRKILSEGDFSLEIPPFTPCEIDIESIDGDLRKLEFECNRIEITKPLEKLFEIGLTIVSGSLLGLCFHLGLRLMIGVF